MFMVDCYVLGVFLLEVYTGEVLQKRPDQVIKIVLPSHLPKDLFNLLATVRILTFLQCINLLLHSVIGSKLRVATKKYRGDQEISVLPGT
jgi:hypothetical protein